MAARYPWLNTKTNTYLPPSLTVDSKERNMSCESNLSPLFDATNIQPPAIPDPVPQSPKKISVPLPDEDISQFDTCPPWVRRKSKVMLASG